MTTIQDYYDAMNRIRAYDELEKSYYQEQEQYAKFAQEIANKIAQSMYYGSGNAPMIVETVTKTTEVRTIVYTFPELDLD